MPILDHSMLRKIVSKLGAHVPSNVHDLITHDSITVKLGVTGMNPVTVSGTMNVNHAAKCLNILFALMLSVLLRYFNNDDCCGN